MSPVMNPFHWNIIILLFCADLIHIREKFFSVDSLKLLFKTVSSDIIFSSVQFNSRDQLQNKSNFAESTSTWALVFFIQLYFGN